MVDSGFVMNTGRHFKCSAARAFTLIEMLCVMFIIAILASLSLAGISRARAKANEAYCVNNVRQMGVALQVFLSDHHVYPLWSNVDYRNGKNTELGKTWFSGLFPDLSMENAITNRGNQVFHCPAARIPSAFRRDQWFADYGYNARGLAGSVPGDFIGLDGFSLATQSYDPLPDSKVTSPADMLAIGDGHKGWDQVITDGEFMLWRNIAVINQAYPNSRAHAMKRHHGKANLAFCDGHVESRGLLDLFADRSDAALRRWNRDNLPHRERLKP